MSGYEVTIEPRWRCSWWVSISEVIDDDSRPRVPMSFGEFGGWHVLGSRARAERNAHRFIARRERKQARKQAESIKFQVRHIGGQFQDGST